MSTIDKPCGSSFPFLSVFNNSFIVSIKIGIARFSDESYNQLLNELMA